MQHTTAPPFTIHRAASKKEAGPRLVVPHTRVSKPMPPSSRKRSKSPAAKRQAPAKRASKKTEEKQEPHFEFGGPVGSVFITTSLPATVYTTILYNTIHARAGAGSVVCAWRAHLLLHIIVLMFAPFCRFTCSTSCAQVRRKASPKLRNVSTLLIPKNSPLVWPHSGGISKHCLLIQCSTLA